MPPHRVLFPLSTDFFNARKTLKSTSEAKTDPTPGRKTFPGSLPRHFRTGKQWFHRAKNPLGAALADAGNPATARYTAKGSLPQWPELPGSGSSAKAAALSTNRPDSPLFLLGAAHPVRAGTRRRGFGEQVVGATWPASPDRAPRMKPNSTFPLKQRAC